MCEDNLDARSKTLRCALTRRKISIFEYLKQWDIDHHQLKCAWCKDHNHDIIRIEHHVHDSEIHPMGVKRRWGAPFLCYSKTSCPSKSVNRNSVEFISKAYGLTTEEAKHHLHTRSKSPFYSSNHTSITDHKLYQSRSREWWDAHGKDRDSWITKANHSRSLGGYLNKHGPSGKNIWFDTQKSKAITLNKMVEQYGQSEGETRYKSWLEGTSHSLEAYVKKHGTIQGAEKYLRKWIYFKTDLEHQEGTFESAILRLITVVSSNPLHVYITFNLDKEMRQIKWYDVFKEYYNISTSELDKILQERVGTYKINPRKIFYNSYSYYSYTNLGTILKSYTEILIYDHLTSLGLMEDTDFKVNQRYPDSSLVYDLFLVRQKTYVEIVGNMQDIAYAEHMHKKQETFDSVLIYPHSYKDQLNQILGVT
jgi:hypothetical protein